MIKYNGIDMHAKFNKKQKPILVIIHFIFTVAYKINQTPSTVTMNFTEKKLNDCNLHTPHQIRSTVFSAMVPFF